jgi:hypothetical protein
MKKLVISLFLLVAAFASAQTTTNATTISAKPAVAVVAGQTACYTNSGYAPCDNTIPSPAVAVGVFLTAGSPGRSGAAATIAVNGVYLVPIPVFGTVCALGNLLGDTDGSGNVQDMGPAPGLVGFPPPVSYVGVCQGMNGALTEMQILIQPGYAL